MTLNERQMSICEDLGLTTNYDELTNAQKNSINRIEELLEYLDEKYDTTFNYLGYNEPFLQSETLKVFTDEFSEYEFTTLTVKDDGSFVDDYPFQYVKRIIRMDFTDYLQNNTDYKYKVYVVNGQTDIADVSKISKEALSGTTEASCTVFINQCEDVDAKKIGEEIAEWYKSLGVLGNTNVIAVNNEVFSNISFDNYESIKREQHLSNLLMIEVSSSGSAKIY